MNGIPAWDTEGVPEAWRAYAGRLTSPVQIGLAVGVIAVALWVERPGWWAWIATAVAGEQLGVALLMWLHARRIRAVLQSGSAERWVVLEHTVSGLRRHLVRVQPPSGTEQIARVVDAGWPSVDDPVRGRPAAGPWESTVVAGSGPWLVLLRDGSHRPALARSQSNR